MSNSKIEVEDNLIYEALVTSYCDDDVHTKAFGVIFKDRFIELNLYPCRTLYNLETNDHFLVQFTDNPLTFTRAVLGKLDCDDYTTDDVLESASIVFKLKVDSMNRHSVFDKYGVNTRTKITARILDTIVVKDKPYLINRATNHIIDLLVEYTRLNLYDSKQLDNFLKNIRACEGLLEKNSNDLHRQSLELIKNELTKE